MSQQWSGPLPPPAALDQFNQIVPGGAERIFLLVEREQAHRLDMDSIALNAMVKDTRRGQWLGASIAILAIIAAVFSVYIGAHYLVSVALVSLPIAAIVQAMVKNKPDK